MTKDDVLKTLIKFFKDVDAVAPNLPDVEIAQKKLPELDFFQHQLTRDPDFRMEVLFKKMVKVLKDAHPEKISPAISPNDETVFYLDITIGTLATYISEDTPD